MTLSFAPPPAVTPAPRARAGIVSLEALHRGHFAYVWRSLRHLGVAPASLDDACQDVFVVAHRRLDEFEGRADPKTWLYAIARRVAADHRRAQRRAARKLAALVVDPPRAKDELEDPVARNEAAAHVFRFLDGLDDDKRAVFTLYAFEGLRGPEIAERLAMNLNTVYARLRIARAGFEQSCRALDAAADRALARAAAASEPAQDRRAHAWAMLVPALGAPISAAPFAFAGAFKLVAGLVLGTTVAIAAVGRSAPPDPINAPTQAIAASPAALVHAPAPEHVAALPVVEIATDIAVPHIDDTPAPAASTRARAPRRVAPPPAAIVDTPVTAEPIAAPAPAPVAPARPAVGDALGDEVSLLGKIRAVAKASDHRNVIALAAAHAETFPHGRLVTERTAYEATARCNLGQQRRGRALAERFLAAQPHAVLATSVRNACFGG
ncbi:MAG TPA: RNA polymerase sigma factor [Nannocystaceae bacterium]|nr:RNA polymerase sigma factor [Nannocystaceae bacterium]